MFAICQRTGLQIRGFSNFIPSKFTGPSYEEVKQNHKDFMFPHYKPYYKEPFYAVQGHRQYLYNDKGEEYLDLASGISCANVGHCHPRLNKIFEDQAGKLLHISPIYMHQYQGEYSKALCEALGEDYDTVYLCNSGSQANDFAHLLARLYTQSENTYCLRQAYHGISGNAYSLSSMSTWNSGMPKMSEPQKLIWPNFYQKPNLSIDDIVADSEQQIRASSNGKQISSLFLEPVMGAGGIHPLPPEYVQKMYKLTKKYGGLYISDEVQTGFGRIGKQFWGFKWHGVKPDIVTTAKAMANGYPMGAVITTKKVMSAWKHNFFNTYGAGVLQCRLGLEVLNIIKEQKLHDNAEVISEYLRKEFKRIQGKTKLIGDVRGKGMMVGVELVKDQASKTPNPEVVLNLMEDLKRERILIAKCGQFGNVLRITGPMCLNMTDAGRIVEAVEKSIKKYE